VVRVTDRHDARHPLVVRYAHHPGLTVYHQAWVGREVVYRTVVVDTAARASHLWVRAEFSQPPTDIDLYLYNAVGRQVGWSESSNEPVGDAVGSVLFYPVETGGPGFENVNGLPVRRCAGITVETKNSLVLQETPVRLLLWLGGPGKGGHD
jgi:hypothetical protein